MKERDREFVRKKKRKMIENEGFLEKKMSIGFVNEKILPAFFRFSSITTDEIKNTFPMLPITDRQANINKRAILDHSEDNVTGEKSSNLLCVDFP